MNVTFRLSALLLFLLAIALKVNAQIYAIGKVQDAFLKIPLPEAKVALLNAKDSTVIMDTIPVKKMYRADGTLKEAQFSMKVEGRPHKYLLKATLSGYETGYLSFAIKEGEEGGYMFLDNALELRKMPEKDLGEVTVTATKVKMFWKGDTLVYDATAFKLPDGSMLDDLIRQMPGVTMNEKGEIFVNNRKIDELQLGSRSFMRGNSKVLLENLPYYTVKNIKVYDQETDLNRAAGSQIENKKFVMDVNLKAEYQYGYIANVEAAGGTDDRWLGRAFLLGFTRNTRYTLLANSNNVNESRHIGSSDYWTPESMPKSLLTTHSVASDIDYQSTDKNIQEKFSIDFTSTRDKGDMTKQEELFLAGSPLQTMKQSTMTKENKLKIGNRFKYIKPKAFMLDADVAIGYKSYHGNTYMLAEQYVDTLITRQHNVGFNDGKKWDASINASLMPHMKKMGNLGQHLLMKANVNYSSDENLLAQQFNVKDFANASSSNTFNTNDYAKRQLKASASLTYGLGGKKNSASIEITPSYNQEKTHDWLYHPDSLLLPSQMDMLQAITDHANSYESKLQSFGTDVMLSFYRIQELPANMAMGLPKRSMNFIDIYLVMKIKHDKLNYLRGQIDTLATRTTIRFNPWANICLYVKKDERRPIHIGLGYNESNTPLIDMVNIHDSSTPLVVRLGNPDLKAWRSVSYILAEYKDFRSPRRNYTLSAGFDYTHNDVAQSVSFNAKNGVYTYRPENIHGAYDAKAKATVFYTLDANRRWTVENCAAGNFIHSLDHAMLAGETQSQVNAVNTLTLYDRAYLQYNKGSLYVRATGDVRWRHSESKRPGFAALNATDFRYGLAARYTIPLLNTTISMDGNMYSRRGYGNLGLNRDDFVLNASASQSFLKGKLVARIEAFDLLHQLSSTDYKVNAQGRTETWCRTLPHYLMGHVIYHFNKNPKRK